MRKRIAILLLAGILAMAACSDDAIDDLSSELDSATDGSVADEVEQNAVEFAAEVEQEMNALAAELQSSEAAADLETAWAEVQTELTTAIASMQTDGSITTDGLESALADFEAELDAAGDEITPELRRTWESLRSKIEEMMA